MTIRAAFGAAVGLFLINELLVHFGVYHWWPNIDVPMHLTGGFIMGMLALALRRHLQKRPSKDWLDGFIFVVGFVAMVAIAWELYEFVLDHTVVILYHLDKSQMSLADTLDDQLNGVIGGAVCYLLQARKR